MHLSSEEREMLAGAAGTATALAMKLLVAVGEAEDAPRFIDIESAHIDGCLYHGRSGLDFARALVDGGGEVRVDTTLNVASIDMLHPELYRGDPSEARLSRALTDAYVELGCRPTWTCAPYQLPTRPAPGEQIAWGESNAIVFANSVLAARTNRYGDFIDICCALAGKAPFAGLHTDEGRRGRVEIRLDVPDAVLGSEILYPLLGYLVGEITGAEVPVIVGLDDRATEDRLKALGAAAASSGAVAMFHAVGVTPEAPDLGSALGDEPAIKQAVVDLDALNRARSELTTASESLGAVSVGTPHMSLDELRRLASLVTDRQALVPFYVNTGREVLGEADAEGLAGALEEFGATVVTDTCTYITPIMAEISGSVMTNSAKWAHYAPANLGVDVFFASLDECVTSAVEGRLITFADWA